MVLGFGIKMDQDTKNFCIGVGLGLDWIDSP